MGRFFSPGKLMLTSEYVALDGALVLSVPTRCGQDFFYEDLGDHASEIVWQAFHQQKLWLRCVINYKNWEIRDTNLPEAAEFIRKVLRTVRELSAEKLSGENSYIIRTNLEFPPDFGLGSSSTLMNNLAQWASVDPFILNEKCLGGSGYDIAVAIYRQPILYRITAQGREISAVDFCPQFKDELIFVHLNQKQNSREGIRLYREKEKSACLIQKFSEITQQAASSDSIADFSALMNLHEDLLSDFLALKTARQLHFPDCPVFIKSLGAWGGDFIMSQKFPGYHAYFSEKGFSTVLNYNDLIG